MPSGGSAPPGGVAGEGCRAALRGQAELPGRSAGVRTPKSGPKVDARAALRQRLGDDLDALAMLSEQESAELLGLIDDARAVQRTALDASIAEVLGRLPRLARGPARRIM